MMSEMKMTIGATKIDFLGMHLKDGQYITQPYIARALEDFPNENLSKKQIQQFLGIINYMSEFLPNLARLAHSLIQMFKKEPPLRFHM